MKARLPALAMLLVSFPAFAQQLQPNFRHLNSVNGLTTGYSKCLFKDSRGFLWIGTNAGLNRFDGKYTLQFSHMPGDSTSLANNDINMICEDTRKRIWVATGGGLSILSPWENKFINYTKVVCDHDTIDFSGGVVTVNLFKNRMWIGTLNNILSASIDSVSFDVMRADMLHTTKKTIRCMPNLAFTTGTGLWISTFSGMFYTSDGKTFFNPEYNPLNWQIFTHPYVLAFYNDGDSVGYFATWRFPGIYKFRYGSDRLDSIPFKDNRKFTFMNFRSLCRTSHDEIWGGTIDHGIISINIHTGAFRFYLPDRTNPQSLSDREIGHLIMDDQGTVFIATGRGVDYINPVQSQFRIFNSNSFSAVQLDDINIDLAEDTGGKLWIGTVTQGLFRLDPETGATEHFTFEGNYNHVWTLYHEQGKLLMGTDGGLATFDISTRRFTPLKGTVPGKVQELTEISTNYILKDKTGNYWIGIWEYGLLKLNLKTNQYVHYSKRDSVHALVAHSHAAISASLDEQERLWLGYMTNDLSCINTGDGSIYHFKLPLERSNENCGVINSLLNDPYGNLWIGTQNGGLYKYDITRKAFTHYDTRNGLSSNSIRSLLLDRKNDLWIIAYNGLNRMNIHSGKTEIFNFSDGLPSNQYKETPCLLASDGSIYAGCDIYLVNFHPDRLQSNPYLPKTILYSYKKSGTPVVIRPDERQLYFSYTDRTVSFEMVGINFIDPDKTRYAYTLDGFDKGWNYNQSNPVVTYTNLPGGDYRLRFKASNRPGNWDVPESFMLIHVQGPFWKSWWFLFLCFLTTGLISFLIYYGRLRQILKLQRVRNKIASDLHDDIGSGLSSISVFSEILRQGSGKQSHEIMPFIEKIDDIARGMSESIHDIVWAINPKNDRFSDVLARMRQFATELLSAKRINFSFDYANDISTIKLRMEQRKNFYLIFKEAINNIAKYAKASNVLITVNVHNHQMLLAIKDDGVGFDPEEFREGNGLTNMKKRADELGGMLQVYSRPGAGTSITLNFNAA